jgi:hypothetical protein
MKPIRIILSAIFFVQLLLPATDRNLPILKQSLRILKSLAPDL